jgi:hypothetical protein
MVKKSKSTTKSYRRRTGLARARDPKEQANVGRPGVYHSGLVDAAYRLALLGATDVEMAEVFGISKDTLYAWQAEHPDFSDSIARGKLPADAQVAERLFRRAIGYSHPAVKIFHNDGDIIRAPYTEHYPPDTAAAKHWLNNRRPQQWRERMEHAGDPTQPVRFLIVTPDGEEEIA